VAELVAGSSPWQRKKHDGVDAPRAVLSTLHFQAPGFYQKQDWEVAARIECEPPGHTRFYMTKKLS
jgi:hypothetical protein